MPRRPSEDRAETCHQFLDAKRLHEVIVGTRVDALDALAPTIAGGEDQHRQGHRYRAEPSEYGEPVETRQTEVEDHGVVGFDLGLEQRGLAVGDHIGHVPGPLQPELHVGRYARLVLGDQDAHGDVIGFRTGVSRPCRP